MSVPRPLSPDELAILETVGRRKLPGTLRRCPERDRLRHSGFIVSHAADFRQGQETLWLLTDLGRAHLESLKETSS